MNRTLLLIALLIPFIGASQDTRIKTIDSLLTAFHSQKKINGNFLIAEKGNVIYKKSFGVADAKTNAQLDENSIFELASCSKQFTAMGIAILNKQGKLKYDDKISKYLPELRFYEGVTIRHLLNHTSGLPDYMELMMDSLWDKKKIATNNDMIAILAKHKPALLFEPNKKFEYSNTGYALLGSIIERASKTDYGTFLQQNIFTPLNMKNTFVYTRRYSPKKVSNYAYGYLRDKEKLILPDSSEEDNYVIHLDGIVGDGTVNSTTNDLLTWDRALYTNKLLSEAEMKEVFSPATLNNGKASKYGFGWMVDSTATFGQVASHSGGWPGYSTYIERDMTNDKTIIFLQNVEPCVMPIKSVRNALYNRPLVDPKPVRKEIKLADDVLARHVGEYQFAPTFSINVTQTGNQLKAQATGQMAFEIFPESETMFFLKVVDAQVEFVNEDGKVTGLILHQNGRDIPGEKIK